jgi:hypothetical protein
VHWSIADTLVFPLDAFASGGPAPDAVSRGADVGETAVPGPVPRA